MTFPSKIKILKKYIGIDDYIFSLKWICLIKDRIRIRQSREYGWYKFTVIFFSYASHRHGIYELVISGDTLKSILESASMTVPKQLFLHSCYVFLSEWISGWRNK